MTINDKHRPHPGDLLTLAFELINARGNEYDNANDIADNYREVAAVATVVIGKDITARDVAMILHCVKLLRSKSAPDKLDNYVDGMNYLAFAACFNGLAPLPLLAKSAPMPATTPLPPVNIVRSGAAE